jgi:hypothetical protein
MAAGEGNVNNVTSAALTNLGGGVTFYDCLFPRCHPESLPADARLSPKRPRKAFPLLLSENYPRRLRTRPERRQ